MINRISPPHVDNHTHTCRLGRIFRLRKVPLRHSGALRPACTAHIPDTHSGRSIVRILEPGRHHDDRPFRGRRSHFPDRSGENDKFEDPEAGRQERDGTFPAGHAGDRRHRGIRQQYRHSRAYAPYSREPGLQCRHESVPAAHAAGFRQQHGRHDDTHRYASEPYHPDSSRSCR